MLKLRNGLAAVAALGLVAAAPASAATRAGQALPAVSAPLTSAPLARSTQPMEQADALRGGVSVGLIIGILAVLIAILLAAGGGGNDSPG